MSCTYVLPYNEYTCFLIIDNWIGEDNFNAISGVHVNSYNALDVIHVKITGSESKNIPKFICQHLPNVLTFEVLNDIGIQSLTTNSFVNCRKITELTIINNKITEIDPRTFEMNLSLQKLQLSNFEVTTLPQELFSTTKSITWLEISEMDSLVDLPANIFQNLKSLECIRIYSNINLEVWRPEWTNSLTNLWQFSIYRNPKFTHMPLNAVNSKKLSHFFVDVNNLTELSYENVNDVSSVISMHLGEQPIEAIDFNLLDEATNLKELLMGNIKCAKINFDDFNSDKEENMKILEPCFEAYDKKIMNFSTTATEVVYNSIRKKEIIVSIKTSADALLTFSNNPDGTGNNFMVYLRNAGSLIYVNGIIKYRRSTPNILASDRFEKFYITWKDDVIYVSHKIPILFHQLEDSFDVKFIGVRTKDAKADWTIQQITDDGSLVDFKPED